MKKTDEHIKKEVLAVKLQVELKRLLESHNLSYGSGYSVLLRTAQVHEMMTPKNKDDGSVLGAGEYLN